jgi:mono/diheme cytochrome c family protein
LGRLAWIGLCLVGTSAGIVAGCGSDDTQSAASTQTAGAAGAGGTSTQPSDASTNQPDAGTGGGSMSGADSGSEAASGTACKVPTVEDDQPKALSQTGCVDPKDPSKPIAAMIPYDVNSPLWSDGATKQRFILLPAGKKIHVKDCTTDPGACSQDGGASYTPEDEGHWDLPVGTILLKAFSVGGKRIETRLLMRQTDTDWLGFSYEWNDAQTDATLLDGAKDKPLATQPAQTWHFPGRAQCLECHTQEGGRSLGPSTQQFNKNFDYPTGTKNQVSYFSDLGLFDAAPAMLAAYPTPSAAGDLTQRARSYLQVNCSICHRPGGQLSDIDLRYTTSFKDTRLCNQPISKSSAMLPPLRLVPGKPADSNISYRMHDTVPMFCGPQPDTCTDNRMPKIGSYLVDPDGSKLIDDWITSITACP